MSPFLAYERGPLGFEVDPDSKIQSQASKRWNQGVGVFFTTIIRREVMKVVETAPTYSIIDMAESNRIF